MVIGRGTINGYDGIVKTVAQTPVVSTIYQRYIGCQKMIKEIRRNMEFAALFLVIVSLDKIMRYTQGHGWEKKSHACLRKERILPTNPGKLAKSAEVK